MLFRQQQQEMLQQAAKHVEKTNDEIVRVQVEASIEFIRRENEM